MLDKTKRFAATHREQLLFFAKLFGIYVAWYVFYELWLLPDGRLDRWLSHNVAAMGGRVLTLLGLDVAAEGRILRMAGAPGVKIINGCNGLSTIGLFAGFVFAFPGSNRRRALFLPLGIVVVYLANVARVAGLAALQGTWPEAFAVVHDFGSTTVFYVVVFALWMVWANYGQPPRVDAPKGETPEGETVTARRGRRGGVAERPPVPTA